MSGQSFEKGLRVLETVARAEGAMSLGEISAACGLGKSNAHQFLSTLVEHGYLRQNGQRGRYEPTFKLWELGAKIIGRLDLDAVARAPMQRLSVATGESVTLAILDNNETLYIAKVDGKHDVRTHPDIGRRRPAYCVSSGKALLAFQSPEVIDAVSRNLKAYTDCTITSADELRAQLADVRSHGYAFNRGEWTTRVRGVAAPIRGARDHVVAAVGISAPAERLHMDALKQLVPQVAACAREISLALGYQG
jgi:IclR family transcriptional regulator, KDG regulon repressor